MTRALPAWPIANSVILQDGFGLQRMLDPISTDMEGGNTRERPRPGDNVGTITQTVRMSPADYDVLVDWVKTTLNNGTARFKIDVWLGTALANKVCQFIKPGTQLTYAYISVDKGGRDDDFARV